MLTTLFYNKSRAQNQEEVVKVQVIDVIKSYTPEISDATKIREYPKIPDAKETKKNHTYKTSAILFNKIFQPDMGNFKPYAIKKNTETKKNNYLYFGYGNANTLSFKTFLQKMHKNHYFKINFNHLSSDANVRNTPVKSLYQNTYAQLDYLLYKGKKRWVSNLLYRKEKRHWYGVAADFSRVKDFDFQQVYHNVHFMETLQIKDALLKKISVNYDLFLDRFSSEEQHFTVKSSLQFPYNDSQIFTDLLLGYLNTKFENANKKFSYLTFGSDLSYPLKEGDFYLSVGLNFRYNKNTAQDEKAKYYLYPNIKINYKFLAEIINAYAGFHGNLYRQSYQNFVGKNPFVAPELDIKMTNRNFNFYMGVKGKLTDKTTYNVKSAYVLEKNTPFFVSNSKPSGEKIKPYEFDNSFLVLYDDITKISFLGQLQTEIIQHLNARAAINYDYYQTKTQKAAWNAPSLSGSFAMNYKQEKWSASFTSFFVGERKDLQKDKILTLPAFMDIGCSGTYYSATGINFSLSLDNLLNSAYQRYLNYHVQGFQVLLGAKFRFKTP